MIYYFSGSGNSLYVAKRISSGIGMDIRPINLELLRQKKIIDKGITVLVFPSYHGDLPNIICDFVDVCLKDYTGTMYAIVTYADNYANSLINLNKRLVNTSLQGGYAVCLPYNYIMPTNPLNKSTSPIKLRQTRPEVTEKMIRVFEERAPIICHEIMKRQSTSIPKKSSLVGAIADKLNLKDRLGYKVWLKMADYKSPTKLKFRDMLKVMDYGFKTNEFCNGCGICAKVCPRENIILVNNIPQFQHDCEQCFACLLWCDKNALDFGKGLGSTTRYHNPLVKVAEMIKRV